MTTILDNFISVWAYWMIPSFLLGLVGFGFLFYVRWVNPTNRKKFLKIGILLFGQTFLTWIIAFSTIWIIEARSRHELKEFLSQNNLSIRINGQTTSKILTDLILKELMNIRNIPAHHSQPTDKIKIEIISKSMTEYLNIARDSERENEYWIYWNKYEITRKSEFGRISTEIFKEYNNK